MLSALMLRERMLEERMIGLKSTAPSRGSIRCERRIARNWADGLLSHDLGINCALFLTEYSGLLLHLLLLPLLFLASIG